MTLQTDLRDVLLNDAGVAAICATRVDWGARPQGRVLPAVVLMQVSGTDGLDLDGPDGLSRVRVQADCYGVTYGAAAGLADAVRAALNGYRGGGFRLIEHAATRDMREGGSNEPDRPFRVMLDFLCHWRAE